MVTTYTILIIMIKKLRLQPIDKFSLSLILAFSLVIGGLVLGGSACGKACFLRSNPRVKEFNWKERKLGAEDTAFVLTFDRPMDQSSVEKNLRINPPLAGKISWAGRRLAYTLQTPIPYGESYEISLKGAKERFREGDQDGQEIEPFVSSFSSRDRAFAYIGTLPEEQGQLILYNVTQQKKTILTPPDLVVMDFKFYPQGDKILFSAAEKKRGSFGIRELQLYTVETTVKPENKNSLMPKIELVLDNQKYQNNKFDLSADGKTIVVQRVNRADPADFDLWMLKSNTKPEKLDSPGGDFLITPDGQTVAVAQGQGIAILPLQPDAKPLEFLPKFGQVLSFSRDGSAAAMVNFNMDNANLRYTKSLYYVNNQGVQKELLNINGSIIDCQFNPTGNYLYCLLTQLLAGSEDYIEQPYLARINIKNGEIIPLVSLPDYREIKISLAPDGLGLLFDQVITSNDSNLDAPLTTNSGESIVNSQLWLLITPNGKPVKGNKPDLNELPLVGFRPQWAP
jgi:hypothetical protein